MVSSISCGVKSWISNHKWLSALTLGVVIAISLTSLGGRFVSWISQRAGTTKKVDDVTKDLLSSKKSDKQPITPIQKIPTHEILKEVIGIAQKNHKFSGFNLPFINSQPPASTDAFSGIKSQMTLAQNVRVNGIGCVYNCYTWNKEPSLDAPIPDVIKNAAVYLPEDMTISEFEEMRKMAQQSVVSKKGLTGEQTQKLALNLGGIVIEATLPCKASFLLGNKRDDVDIHYIFQTGLNFAGEGGGGIPLTDLKGGSTKITDYYKRNAEAAISSAIKNKSDVLVFNAGIGTGFFGGNYKESVKQANIDGICSAYREAKNEENTLQVIVVGFSEAQKKQLNDLGIQTVKADKDTVAALLAKHLRVSLTIAGDPMSIIGIHGPGFWWETVGSASDEERAAFLTPCYVLGHIPITVYSKKEQATKIAALSEFMRELE